jgi:diguanylate cyclase (GGDEF)-like protein
MTAKRNLLLGFFVLVAVQPHLSSLDRTKAVKNFIIDSWAMTEGLMENSVLAIVQTGDGYLWMGTNEGLARFDGVKFKVFDRDNTPEITISSIFSLFEDSSGFLWIGTNGDGVLRYKNGTFRKFSTQNGLSNDFAYAIHEDKGGRIWVGTNNGLNVYQDGQWKVYTTRDGLSNNFIWSLCDDKQGNVWIGTNGGGLDKLNGDHFEILSTKNGFPSNIVWSLDCDESGRVWAGTMGGGLAIIKGRDIKVLTKKDGLLSNEIRCVFHDRLGTLWIGSDNGGLNRITGDKIEGISKKEGLNNNFVRSIAEDREGSIWVGTYSGGLNRLRDASFVNFNTQHGLPTDLTRSVFEDSKGRIWIGTVGDGALFLENGKTNIVGEKQGLTNNRIWSIWENASKGEILLGSYGGGLFVFSENKIVKNYNSANGLANDIVRAIFVDGKGDTWVGTNGGGIDIISPEGKISNFSTRNGLTDNFIYSIRGDKNGAIWIGTVNGGVLKYNNGEFTAFSVNEGLSVNGIWCLYPDDKGNVWCGTNFGGLCRIRDGKVKVYSVHDGIFTDNIIHITKDENDCLWMVCNKGIFYVMEKDLDAFDRGENKKIRSVLFGTAEGLKGATSGGPSSPGIWLGKNGIIWCSTIHGIISIDPHKKQFNDFVPPVVVENVIVDGVRSKTGNSISIKPGHKRVVFEYTALSLLVPDMVKFSFILDGFDRAWNKETESRSAEYTNLAPGNYTFKVRACNNNGKWNMAGASLNIKIMPFFYQTNIFYFLVFAAFMAVVFGLFRLRLRSLKQREEQLARLIEERTKSLNESSNLLSIANIELEKKSKELEEVNQHLEKLSFLDSLTGIANRRYFEQFADFEWKRGRRYANPMSMIMIDIDFFKEYNDTYGHIEGDNCLKKVAHALNIANRAGDLVARIGGDEFVVILFDTDSNGAAYLAKLLQNRIHECKISHKNSKVSEYVTLSLGISSMVPNPENEFSTLVKNADKALYRAKNEGRNKFCTTI